jgi:hypothetical protein
MRNWILEGKKSQKLGNDPCPICGFNMLPGLELMLRVMDPQPADAMGTELEFVHVKCLKEERKRKK